MAKLTDSQLAFFEEPFVGIATTIREDGSPHNTVVWVDVDNGVPSFNTALGRVKPRNLAHDPRVCLSLADPEHPYSNVSIQGAVVETIEGDEALRDIDALATKYMGVETYPFLQPGERRVTYVVEPRHVWYRPPARR